MIAPWERVACVGRPIPVVGVNNFCDWALERNRRIEDVAGGDVGPHNWPSDRRTKCFGLVFGAKQIEVDHLRWCEDLEPYFLAGSDLSRVTGAPFDNDGTCHLA